MKIKWYGHACFRIEGDDIVIVTDPYTPEVAGLDPVGEPANVVVMSSACPLSLEISLYSPNCLEGVFPETKSP